ncbi:MAG: class I tRNA ligase family protein [Candidatus Saccharimonadales bacterium]
MLGYDKSTKKFLGLRSTMPDHHAWLAGGGINEGETFDECAKRELREETGYDAEELIQLGQPVFSHYFNEKKNSYRRSFAPHYLAYVSGEPNTAAREDHETFDIEWFTYDELYRDIEKTGGGVEHWLEVLERARKVIAGEELEVFHGDGVLINSGAFDGVASAEARDLIVQHLEREGKGRAKTTYKLRDWSVSRQRYWGAPIPIINCPRDGAVLVPDDQLPVVLPELTDFAPSGDGRSALARATEWLTTTCPTCGGPAERETDTLDTYICSSWYELRYFDPANTKKPFEPATANKWMPIDFYNGGDHATAHLLYVRFVARFFHTLGLLDNPEPFKKFLFNGKVKASDGSAFSKSKGNGVDPLEIINQGYGADALRTYLMFAAPLDLDSRWDPQGVPGTHRFLSRIWNLAQEFLASDPQSTRQLADQNPKSTDVLRIIHRTIKKVTEDLESQKYNTAIAAMMKCVNELYEAKTRDGFADRESWQCALESLAALVAPFAPHTADELWHQLGHGTSVQRDSWPVWDDRYLVDDTLKLAVQVNGKVRAEITIAADTPKADIEAAALSHERIVELLGDKKPARVIYVPGRLVNIVV